MSLAYLDDPAAPPPPPWEAVTHEVGRRRARRRNVAVAGSGLAMLAFLAVVALVGWPTSRAPVQVALRPEPTTTVAPPAPPVSSAPNIVLTPATGDAAPRAVGGGSQSSTANSGASGLSAVPCTAANLSLKTEVTAADIRQGAIVRLHLVNVSGAPCTLVTDACVDSSFTILTPQGTSVSKSSADRSCPLPPSARVLEPGADFGMDDIWPASSGATPGRYVARGSWRVGDQVVTGTAAPFTL